MVISVAQALAALVSFAPPPATTAVYDAAGMHACTAWVRSVLAPAAVSSENALPAHEAIVGALLYSGYRQDCAVLQVEEHSQWARAPAGAICDAISRCAGS